MKAMILKTYGAFGRGTPSCGHVAGGRFKNSPGSSLSTPSARIASKTRGATSSGTAQLTDAP